jgi:hypothetical protein
MRSTKEVDLFLKLLIQTKKVLEDFLELSRKKPDGAVNKFKLTLVNTILEQANSILDTANKPFGSFSIFNEDDVPTNSDVVVILSQYLGCLKKFGRDNTRYHDYRHYWLINGKLSDIEVDWNQLTGT